LQAGSLDLLVNGANDPNVLPFWIKTIIPDKAYDVTKVVRNVGTIDGWLYLHIKNVLCTETNDKDINGDGIIDALDTPEPERIAQTGGKVGQKTVPGVGVRCDMEKHISTEIWFGPKGQPRTKVDLSAYDKNHDGVIKLNELMCEQILVGQLIECGAEFDVNFVFTLQDVPEEYYNLDIFDQTDPHEVKWNCWPTNCYMGDTVSFDVLFELLQTDYTPP
jgi:hypothetical protein